MIDVYLVYFIIYTRDDVHRISIIKKKKKASRAEPRERRRRQ